MRQIPHKNLFLLRKYFFLNGPEEKCSYIWTTLYTSCYLSSINRCQAPRTYGLSSTKAILSLPSTKSQTPNPTMAFKFVDVTIVVFLFITATFTLVACCIPEWSRRDSLVLPGTNGTAPAVERIGLWRTCTEINDFKTCFDSAQTVGEASGCKTLLNATRVLIIVFLTFTLMGALALLFASGAESKWTGMLSVLLVAVAMVTGLACWACWLSLSTRSTCGLVGSRLGAVSLFISIQGSG